MSYRLGSLFSGIGGLDHGLELTGCFRTVFQVEIAPFPRKVLAKHWPNVPRFEDVRAVNASVLPECDVLAGGFPCQDISSAHTNGSRRGLAGERSGLWSEYARLIEELSPRLVIVENSPNWRAWVPQVRRDLWNLGYASLPVLLSARDFGAHHHRPRVFVVADADRQSEPLRALDAEVARLRALPVSRGYWRDTPPGIFRVADGLPGAMDRNRGIGNAVSPIVAQGLGNLIAKAGLLDARLGVAA
jgi:DNA (cytosine-5)-methyltransferase 1